MTGQRRSDFRSRVAGIGGAGHIVFEGQVKNQAGYEFSALPAMTAQFVNETLTLMSSWLTLP
jgi:hypothetical protein